MSKVVFSLTRNSPTFIATADLHLGKKLYNFPELEEDLKDNFVRLVDLAIDKKVDYIVIAGDLFNDNLCKPPSVGFVISEVERAKTAGVKIIGVAGDHDKPVKNECWSRISRVSPVIVEPAFAGLDYFDYSTVSIEDIVAMLRDGRDPDKIRWIFLHCQFPQIFDRAEPKKTIDFNRMMLFENFPNIQGIIAGDLHFAPETRAYGVGHEAYVGYPGSLGITDMSEAAENKSVLYCDGKDLYRLPFEQRRRMIEVDFKGEAADNFDVMEHIEWAKSQKFKPVIKVLWNSNSCSQLNKLTKLYDYALVKLVQITLLDPKQEGESEISCRLEATSEAKIDKALHICCQQDEELYQLASTVLKNDTKDTLDAFKDKYKL